MDLYFASRDAGRAAAFAREFRGSGSFGSYESAVADDRVDAVYVCTPHHLHLEHARLAAAANKPILMEKPLARTGAEARAIIAAAQGTTLMVAENYRFMPPVMAAKQKVESGELGDLRLIQLQEDFPFQPGGWRNDAQQNGGGVLIDGGIHKASLLAYLAGDPREIYAAGGAVVSAGAGRRGWGLCHAALSVGTRGRHQPYLERRAAQPPPLGDRLWLTEQPSLRVGRRLAGHHHCIGTQETGTG